MVTLARRSSPVNPAPGGAHRAPKLPGSSTLTGRIARSTSVLTLATGLSRVLGFVRDLLIARLFGTLAASQAFVVAFRLPNLLRDLVAEGAVTSAFVPVLSWHAAKEGREEFWRLSQALGCRVLVLVTAIGLLGSLFAPSIVRITAPGFAADPEKFALTVRLTRILFPFITLVGLWAYFMGVLNSLRHFAVPALGPAILNVAMIAGCLLIAARPSAGIIVLAASVMIGGVVQLLLQLPVAMRLGFRWRWRWAHPGSREILRLLGPRIVGSAVYQGSVVIHTALASLAAVVGDGAVAALYFANRLVQLPLALFGTAAAQASLPSLAEQAATGDLAAFRATLLSVLRMVGFIILPSAVGLIVLAFPIVGGLFERGAFDHRSTVMTVQALSGYSLGLLAYALSKVLTGAFYALKDTRTPVRLAMEALSFEVLVSLALMWPLKVAGLALAAALGNSLNAYRLLRQLEQRLDTPLLRLVRGAWRRILAASLVMGAACRLLWSLGGFAARPVLGLAVVIPLGVACYLLACRVMGVAELSTALRWLRRPNPS